MTSNLNFLNNQNEFSTLYLQDESVCIENILQNSTLSNDDRLNIEKMAHDLVETIKSRKKRMPLIDSFLQEYNLSTEEGVTLMRLSEALIRTPDKLTAFKLIRDKLTPADWQKHKQKSPSTLVNTTTHGLRLTKTWINATGGVKAKNLAARLGDNALYAAISQTMSLMGDHFVIGRDIAKALKKSKKSVENGYCYSYDMLGEAAHTQEDAERYFQAYADALNKLSSAIIPDGDSTQVPSLSIKLSAIHPRYEYAQRNKCVPELLSKLKQLALVAKSKGVGLTIDAEEAERLEISLLIFNALLKDDELTDWSGLGIVVQAYQRRAVRVIEHLVSACRDQQRTIAVRLVKGAYWDSEIKRAQELGLSSYPVFTRKENTDVSFIYCAQLLLNANDVIFPQFATHNAHTACAVKHMAAAKANTNYEFQRLHGMGNALHDLLIERFNAQCRIYAPVGKHEDLLPYLVRRLLENGANSSFVNQLSDPDIDIASIIADPMLTASVHKVAGNPKIIAPRDQFNGHRLAAVGIDLTQAKTAKRIEQLYADPSQINAHSLISAAVPDNNAALVEVKSPFNQRVVGTAQYSDMNAVDVAINAANASEWLTQYPSAKRIACLNRAADLLEERLEQFLTMCVKEAGKTWPDAIAEIREAVDFCRYYATEVPHLGDRKALGVVACISPWNFPLAIYLGQVVSALAAGNTVVAKPAPQTPLIAFMATQLLFDAGVPNSAVQLLIGDGPQLGTALISHAGIAAICFTGSTKTAKFIANDIACRRANLIPFIAETGGINSMFIDSTALLEQAVTDVVTSAFQSAGQRCSACRLVCIQEEVADDFIAMLSGAMNELILGDPSQLATDVGPVIDQAAQNHLQQYIQQMRNSYDIVGETKSANLKTGFFVPGIAVEIPSVRVVVSETFGPVLHIVRFKANELEACINSVNRLGFGLTMGLHTRIDDRVALFEKTGRIGNLYVNRNQIGAVVGVQPFGGIGFSGTGPKAGGPYYLRRLSTNAVTSEELTKKTVIAPKAKSQQTSPTTYFELAADIIAKGTLAIKQWQVPKTLLISKLTQLAQTHSSANDTDSLPKQLAAIHALSKQVHCLPGPTGEDNKLSMQPRGIVVCMGDISGADKQLVSKQAILAVSAGNAIVVSESDREHCSALVELLAPHPDLIQFLPKLSGFSLPSSGVHVVMVNDAHKTQVAAQIYATDCPIIPILSCHDDPERLFTEHTVSINTTAAGGNATLLAL